MGKPLAFNIVLSLLLWYFGVTAASVNPPLPADVTMNKEAGRGGCLIVNVTLQSGEELPFLVDTGTPVTLLDKSLAPRLGERLASLTFSMLKSGEQKCGVYAAPKLYMGNVPLMTGRRVVTYDFKKLSAHTSGDIKGILGMDCLGHYCIQLDFEAGKMRFLDANHLDPAGLGKPYPIQPATNTIFRGVPLIQSAGLLAGTVTNTVIDTGNDGDGLVQGKAIRQHAAGSYSGGLIKRTKHFLAVKGVVNRNVALPECVWEGNTYTNIAVGRGSGDLPNWLGLRFLARHLATLDFPKRMLYLKQTSIGPLNMGGRTCMHLLHAGQKYSLSYFGQNCMHEGYAPLPEEHYDALASWAFNASHARILSQFDRYRILTRLSTLDTRGEKGFAHGPCNFGPWADYKWADHAAQAFYGVSDCLGETPLVTDSLVKPLVKSGLAQKDRDSVLEFKESKKLSNAKRSRLVRVFSDAENSLCEEQLLLAVPRTLDEAAREKPEYESARRKTFGRFSLIRD